MGQLRRRNIQRVVDMGIKNKTAVVTGGSRGIGKATCKALLEQDYKVIFCGKEKANVKRAEKELKKYGEVEGHIADLSKVSETKKFAEAIPNLDVLVNNAGVAYYKNFQDSSEEEINQTIDVNIRALILLTKYLLPKINKNGLIINISSGAGKHGFGGLAVYCASKFAVLGFTESLAQELKGIKVISICPGGVDTDMYMSMSSKHPSLKPEHIASKVTDICLNTEKYKPGSSLDVYKVSDALNYLRFKYFRK
ncbi:MAG TPA: SDR family oxidoreductase [archaeon]|nr:SDR family oxidoreductase [archaeon]